MLSAVGCAVAEGVVAVAAAECLVAKPDRRPGASPGHGFGKLLCMLRDM